MISIAHRLGWTLVSPPSRTFDAAPAREIAERILHPLATRARDADAWRCTVERDLDLALIARYGAWVAGWNWSTSEPGGGGPIRGWCCARDSVLPRDEPVEATIDRVVEAVAEWHAFLEEIARAHAELATETGDWPREEAIEHAARRYVGLVVERTGASDAWYSTFIQVLSWHLEAIGHERARIEPTVRSIVAGRFRSWCAPSESVAAEVCAELGLALAPAPAPAEVRDALTDWIEVRERARWERERRHAPGPVARDGHRAFIERHDRARSEERAHRMENALALVRGAADRPLDWTLVRSAQALVLGDADPSFRSRDAFAKDGRERYGAPEGTRARFEACLAQTEDAAIAPIARAARVYLDVCFFHPFADGNARAARLALDHVLTRAGLALHSAEPVFLLPRRAGDPRGPWELTYLLDQLAGPVP